MKFYKLSLSNGEYGDHYFAYFKSINNIKKAANSIIAELSDEIGEYLNMGMDEPLSIKDDGSIEYFLDTKRDLLNFGIKNLYNISLNNKIISSEKISPLANTIYLSELKMVDGLSIVE